MKFYADSKSKRIIAQASSKRIAWQLIRNECHKLGLTVPTIDKIIRVDAKTKATLKELGILP